MTCDTDRLFGLGADGWVAVFTLVLAASTIGLWFASLRASKEAKLQHMVSNRAFAYLSGFEAVK